VLLTEAPSLPLTEAPSLPICVCTSEAPSLPICVCTSEAPSLPICVCTSEYRAVPPICIYVSIVNVNSYKYNYKHNFFYIFLPACIYTWVICFRCGEENEGNLYLKTNICINICIYTYIYVYLCCLLHV
jgi:hypothetical protein